MDGHTQTIAQMPERDGGGETQSVGANDDAAARHVAVPLPASAGDNMLTTQSLTNPVGRVRIDSATSLWRAAEHGDLGRLKMLLSSGHDVNAWCDEAGWKHKTPLSAAVEGNEPLAVRLLLRKGANPDLQDGDGDRYPLHWASAFGDHDECAELLVQAGASLDARDARGHTPLEYARGSADGKVHGFARLGSALLGQEFSREKVVAVLERAEERRHAVRAGAEGGPAATSASTSASTSVSTAAATTAASTASSSAAGTGPCWSPALAKERLGGKYWKAAAAGDLATLEQCLDEYEQPIDQPRPAPVSRLTALAIAAFEGRTEAVRCLLARRANPNVQEGEGGFTPLHFCAHSADHSEAAALLLEAGADPLLAKKDGVTPADYASAHRQGRPNTGALLSAAAARQTAKAALAEALAQLEAGGTWRRPSAVALAELAKRARSAGVDDILVGHAEAGAARLRVEEKEAASVGWGAWALSAVTSVFSGGASSDEAVDLTPRDPEVAGTAEQGTEFREMAREGTSELAENVSTELPMQGPPTVHSADAMASTPSSPSAASAATAESCAGAEHHHEVVGPSPSDSADEKALEPSQAHGSDASPDPAEDMSYGVGSEGPVPMETA